MRAIEQIVRDDQALAARQQAANAVLLEEIKRDPTAQFGVRRHVYDSTAHAGTGGLRGHSVGEIYPWTVSRIGRHGRPDQFQALNTVTGEEGPLAPSYGQAESFAQSRLENERFATAYAAITSEPKTLADIVARNEFVEGAILAQVDHETGLLAAS